MRIPQLGLLLFTALGAGAPAFGTDVRDDAAARRRNEVVTPRVSVPLVFIENAGQFGQEVRYQVRIPGLTLAVHEDGWSLAGETSVRVRFEGATGRAKAVGQERLRATASYFAGRSGPEGRPGTVRNAPTFASVLVDEVKPGMDLMLFENGGRLEYDVRLEPGVSVDEVVFRYEGVEDAMLAADGSLVALVGGRELRQRAPVTWQVEADGTRRELVSSFRALGDDRFGFLVEGRDPRLPVVIDPILIYSEFIGGSNADVARGVALDWDGNVYVTGWAKSADFPGSKQSRRGRDVVVFKLDASGRELLYAAFVGGGNDEEGADVAVTPSGEAVVVGYTKSSDFPATDQAFSRERAGGSDAFALRLSADGSELRWATFLGGRGDDEANALAMGSDGSVYVVGTSKSSDYPTASYSYQPQRKGGRDAFLTRLDDQGKVLVFSTYLGGVRDEEGYDVALDRNGNAYVAGRSDSADFPTTLGAFDSRKADVDGFVTKVSVSGASLIYSTFLGGTGQDEALSIAIDEGGQAWVAGWTQSYDFPTTLEALQEENRARRDGFAARLSTSGGSLTYSTYVGGSGTDEVFGLALDAYGVAWLVGTSSSDDLPVSPDASQEARSGGRDAFLIGIDPASGRLTFGSYLGSGGHEAAHAVATQPLTGNVVLAGQAENIAPAERGRLSGDKQGPSDALVARFEPGLCGLRAELTVLGAGGGVELAASPPRLGKPFEIAVTGGPPNTRGYVLISSSTATSTVVENLLELHVDRATAKVLFSFTTDERGAWRFETVLPRLAESCGRSAVLQALTLDRDAGPLSFGQLSQGLLLTLGD